MYFTSNKRLAQEIADRVLERGAAEGRPYGDLIQEEVQRIFEVEEIKMGVIEPLEFDQSGRIKYNPGLHHNQSRPWDNKEIVYLMEWYSKIGIEEMSLALGRSEGTIGAKVADLRQAGLMDYRKPPAASKMIPRTNGNIKYYKHKNQKRGRICKISKTEVEKIIELKKTMTYVQIAELYGVSKDTIYRHIQLYKSNL